MFAPVLNSVAITKCFAEYIEVVYSFSPENFNYGISDDPVGVATNSFRRRLNKSHCADSGEYGETRRNLKPRAFLVTNDRLSLYSIHRSRLHELLPINSFTIVRNR